MKKGLQCFEKGPENFHNLSTIVGSNVIIDQLLLVMIQWTHNQISPTLIMKRSLQCFEKAIQDFQNLSTIAQSNVAINQSLLVMIQWTYS
jgi:hypothetical protein